MRFHLRDRNRGMVTAWSRAFEGLSDVQISEGDIFAPGHPTGGGVAIVSPANSFGHMDGGIDLVYSLHFGWDVEKRLRALLAEEHDGELPVGNAVVVPTGHGAIPWLISAPTMRVPMNVEKTANAFLAFRAAIRAAQAQRGIIDVIYCPGLATANGSMPYERAARQMRSAYDAIIEGRTLQKGGLAAAVRHHMELVGDSE